MKYWTGAKYIGAVSFTCLLITAQPASGVPNHSSLLDQIDHYQQEGQNRDLSQVNSVFQLSDVSPDDWAFTALQNLVEKYNCLVGYPDGTFRGDRALTRYEFAAGLNACISRLETMLLENTVSQADFVQLQALVQEFEAELATLGAQVDDLEGRVDFLEAHQFSTTTKLEGKVIFAAIDAFGDDVGESQFTFGNRVRLNLDTSFTGQDNLRIRLAAANAVTPNIGTPEGSLAFADDESGGNDVAVDALVYTFPLTEKLTVALAANAGASDDFASTINYLDGDGNEGALTNFATRNPIYYQIEDKGVGFEYFLNDRIIVSAGYMAPDANDPSEEAGLFDGAYGALGQIHFLPTDNFEFGLTYLNSYNLSDTGTGSNRSNLRAFTEELLGEAVPTSSNSYGIEASWQISDGFVLGGWTGYSNIRALSSLDGQIDRGSLDVWNWAVTAALPDLFTDGALGGLIVGMEPKVTSSSIQIGDDNLEDEDTSLHFEAFYQYPINENIMITPGLVWLTSPDHNNDNSDILIGTIRTLFSF